MLTKGPRAAGEDAVCGRVALGSVCSVALGSVCGVGLGFPGGAAFTLLLAEAPPRPLSHLNHWLGSNSGPVQGRAIYGALAGCGASGPFHLPSALQQGEGPVPILQIGKLRPMKYLGQNTQLVRGGARIRAGRG